MAASRDLIDFDIIEGQKENIQALPSGRSAKKLAELFSASPLHKLATPTPSDTKNINDCIRAEYETEVANISESDDPLDVYDRYVRWIFDAYPSAQATPQSQLHTVLERATKAFITSPQYKNDPRYLKLWLQYIHFFADAPRETFVFLSRHSIGEGLALFYEEYAAWLEGAGRWAQAEEVYKLGIAREARPAQRLVRKFGEFEQRRAAQPDDDSPDSPALPTVRPALAAKIDPFAAAAVAMRDPQAPRLTSGVGSSVAKATKSKLQIFSDVGDAAPSAMGSGGPAPKGWNTIGSLADRKKENTMEPKPWVGETLKAGGKKSTAPKMVIFKDQSKSQISNSHITIAPSKYQVTVNPANGKKERVFVDLQAVYPSPEEPGTELSFEEIWAANRGWLGLKWEAVKETCIQEEEFLLGIDENIPPSMNILAGTKAHKLVVHHDVVSLDENGCLSDLHQKAKSKKKKVMEVNETQIIKAKLDSPSGRKIRKRTAEPTMTIHTKAATDDIYDIFNAPLPPPPAEDETSADDDDYETDGDYTSGAESTGTTRLITTSEAGDDDEETDTRDETSDVKSVSEWSEFSTKRHVPDLADSDDGNTDDEVRSQVSDLIDIRDSEPSGPLLEHFPDQDYVENEDKLRTPVEEEHYDENEDDDDLPPRTRTTFVPIPPENYVPNPRPFRDPVEAANNRLPFMTPITERTESSLQVHSDNSDRYGHTKTPSKSDGGTVRLSDDDDVDLEPLSSPLRDVVDDFSPIQPNFPQPLLQKPKPLALKPVVAVKPVIQKGPIIKDAQCNPVDDIIRNEILANMQPPLSSYPNFYSHQDEKFERSSEIRKFAKSLLSKSSRNSTDRTTNLGAPIVLQFPGVKTEYTLKRELGAGAFAPVYLVENASLHGDNEEDEVGVAMGKGAFAVAHNRRSNLEALKMETPPTSWEFYIMRLSHTRLGPQHRATASLSTALEMHLYQDEAFLFLPFHPHGTLLEVVNIFRAEASGVMDEQLAMFFTIELFRTVEALHSKQILHGDLKADNCLLRLDDTSEALSSQWHADGTGSWGLRGVTLIDFGRGIDMRAFTPEVQFIADWKTTAQDCAEMREGRPWTWQIDYHGLAGIVHCLLFGKYIETVRADAGGLGTAAGRKYKIRESLKRYWQTEIWAECFDVLLNPSSFIQEEDGARMPVLKSMGRVREKMEAWLERNCERGVGLKSLMAKVEASVRARR